MKHDSKRLRRNNEISADNVRVIGEDGNQIGVMSLYAAIQAARAADLDLIEITPNASPPIVKIGDYSKMMFELQKKQKQMNKNQSRVEVREIQLRPVTDENDYQVKIRKAVEFLQDGNKVRVLIKYFGREIVHQDLGEKMLQRIVADLAPYGSQEKSSVLERKNLIAIFTPPRKK